MAYKRACDGWHEVHTAVTSCGTCSSPPTTSSGSCSPPLTASTRHMWCPPSRRARDRRQGHDAVSGDLGDVAVYRRAFRTGHEPWVAVPASVAPVCWPPSRGVAPTGAARAPGRRRGPGTATGMLPSAAILEQGHHLLPRSRGALGRSRAARAGFRRKVLDPAGRVLILMQDDPDPDAIASALALRIRARGPARAATHRDLRPDHQAREPRNDPILDIAVEQIQPAAVRDFDAVALVTSSRASSRRASATSRSWSTITGGAGGPRAREGHPAVVRRDATILTEYLRAADAKIRTGSPRRSSTASRPTTRLSRARHHARRRRGLRISPPARQHNAQSPCAASSARSFPEAALDSSRLVCAAASSSASSK